VNLADFTSASLIIPQLRSQDASGVILELSQALHRADRLPESLPFYDAVLKRESLASTEMEAGIALPHARLPGLRETCFAFGRSDKALAWSAGRAPSVQVVFLLAGPEADCAGHLLLLSGLARLAREGYLIGELRNAREAGQIFQILKTVQLRANLAPATAKASLSR